MALFHLTESSSNPSLSCWQTEEAFWSSSVRKSCSYFGHGPTFATNCSAHRSRHSSCARWYVLTAVPSCVLVIFGAGSFQRAISETREENDFGDWHAVRAYRASSTSLSICSANIVLQVLYHHCCRVSRRVETTRMCPHPKWRVPSSPCLERRSHTNLVRFPSELSQLNIHSFLKAGVPTGKYCTALTLTSLASSGSCVLTPSTGGNGGGMLDIFRKHLCCRSQT